MAKVFGFILGFILTLPILIINVFGWALLVAFPIMWIWNKELIKLFDLPPITYWQSLLLYIFCSILFKPMPIPPPPNNENPTEENQN